mgnify:CR=1 FL=1
MCMFEVNHPTPTFMVLDDFYENPMAVREWVLQQEFPIVGNYPGKRTQSFASEEIRQHLEKFVRPLTGDITSWSDKENYFNANGCFQYTLENDVSWMHTDDNVTDWAGVLYLTPDAPLDSGTGLYRFNDGTRFAAESDETHMGLIHQNAGNMDAWEIVDQIGNVFNRLILFNAQHWHRSMEYFGDSKENGRLFQLFFFSTEQRLTNNILPRGANSKIPPQRIGSFYDQMAADIRSPS